jgi:hypothetical protein
MWGLNPEEIKLYRKLNSPAKVQDYLNSLRANFEMKGETSMSPRRVIKTKMAHCVEAAVFAATVFWFHKQEPLLMDLRSAKHDFDHVVALFKVRGRWGAVSKSNHAVLRYREPVYATPRELAMSCFHEYYDDNGHKTMRDFSVPFNLKRYKDQSWITSEDDNWFIPNDLDKIKHTKILMPGQANRLRKADQIELDATDLIEWKKANH